MQISRRKIAHHCIFYYSELSPSAVLFSIADDLVLAFSFFFHANFILFSYKLHSFFIQIFSSSLVLLWFFFGSSLVLLWLLTVSPHHHPVTSQYGQCSLCLVYIYKDIQGGAPTLTHRLSLRSLSGQSHCPLSFTSPLRLGWCTSSHHGG